MEDVRGLPDVIALLENVIQGDSGARAARMKGLLGAPRTVAATQGPEEARRWARRAVSPLVDYSSLNALHRFLPLRTAHQYSRLAFLPAGTDGSPTFRMLPVEPRLADLPQFVERSV